VDAKLLIAITAALCAPAFAQTPPAKPSMAPVCGTCHKPVEGTMRGYLDHVTLKSSAMQLNLGAGVEIIKFDPKLLKVIDAGQSKKAEYLRDVKKGHEIRIEFIETDGVKTATLVSLKGPIQIAQEKLIGYEAIERLVALGPEKGAYALIDSRPAVRFQEGTIPTAVNLPFPAFDKFIDRLPQDKDRLVVFFCQGITCMMSPNSLKRAEAMGYANVKVYREGWPEWTQKNYGAISPASVNEAFVKRDIPHVMIDVRKTGEAQRTGFIPGAVALPLGQLESAVTTFPEKELKAPIMVYDLSGGDEAVQAARLLTRKGYENVLVVTGGLSAWQAAGLAIATGTPAVKVAYAPKPRAGAIAVDEFVRIAKEMPSDVLVLDVRSKDEAKYGTIKGALHVPDDEILARLAEIPKDKLIVTHCSGGVRAEMAYHKLKEKGYRVAFLNAEIDIGKDGRFTVN
jgi:rhodanese-related sulfurtransferase